ncbi:hypothetical protein [Haloarcula argentinensis]|uniref:Uncharacterized protein n=1 Tax=Haloarcula argentinensis TaxID=43776 RepID=A0A830FR94_HALAR|nr:hypothetical protein [Haloarcula argentinensis]EMA26746.1 hypothetical protein C443_00217 [Haloarcula argentinensis DSM 12282]MDS0255840.1 hypothetical protein [Haloarcula argentinensis]GGM49961.1 hypothetical protein GCM10009006_34020 [Haloarcula argentinensis]
MGSPPLDRSHIILYIGVIFLIAGAGLVYVGYPAYTTSIVAQEPNREAMATAVESYSASEIEPIAFSNLSAPEQTAITRASQSSQLTYTDRGASDSGTHFNYRNDIVNSYFVSYNESILQVKVVIAMNPVSVGAGSLSGVGGAILVIGGLWGHRHSD